MSRKVERESRIIYRSKDHQREKAFDALEWLAAMTSHIPDQREQMARYYSFYSNVSRGLRQKENQDSIIPFVLEPEENAKPNRNWARLTQIEIQLDYSDYQLPGYEDAFDQDFGASSAPAAP